MPVITGVDDSFQFDNEAVPTEEEKLKKESQKEQRAELFSTRFRSSSGSRKALKPCAARCSTRLLRHFSRMV
jgi:hypothetical protein